MRKRITLQIIIKQQRRILAMDIKVEIGYVQNSTVILTNKPAFIFIQGYVDNSTINYGKSVRSSVFEYKYDVYKYLNDNKLCTKDYRSGTNSSTTYIYMTCDLFTRMFSLVGQTEADTADGHPCIDLKLYDLPYIFPNTSTVMKYNPIKDAENNIFNVLTLSRHSTINDDLNDYCMSNIFITPCDKDDSDFKVFISRSLYSLGGSFSGEMFSCQTGTGVSLADAMENFYEARGTYTSGSQQLNDYVKRAYMLSFVKIKDYTNDSTSVPSSSEFIASPLFAFVRDYLAQE